MHTEFGDSRISRSVDMIAGIETENASCDPDRTPFKGGLSLELCTGTGTVKSRGITAGTPRER